MKTMTRFAGLLRWSSRTKIQADEAELVYTPRPMTSFFDSLSSEQKSKLRAYRGLESHGEMNERAEASTS